MTPTSPPHNGLAVRWNVAETAAVDLIAELLAIPGGSGREAAVADRVRTELLAAGLPPDAVVHDGAHTRSPFGGECGNLVARLPGRGALAGAPALMLSAHLDTVPLCVGAEPERRGDRLVAASRKTALGADNRSGVAALLTVARELRRQPELAHPPLTLLFTVQEELGLVGARWLERELLGDPRFCVNVDGGAAHEICHAAIGGVKWRVELTGKAAHAGVHPRDGISAAGIFATALHELIRGGWHGAVEKPAGKGTANVGALQGGGATNVVMDALTVVGECRSHQHDFLDHLVNVYQETFLRSAMGATNDAGERGDSRFTEENRYPSFRQELDSPPVVYLKELLAAAGIGPTYRISNGGQDANMLNEIHRIPTVTIGAGAHNLHTVHEYLDLNEYLDACRLLLGVVTGERAP